MKAARSNFKSNWENRAGRGVEKSKRPGGLGRAVEKSSRPGVLAIYVMACVLVYLLAGALWLAPHHPTPNTRENPAGGGFPPLVTVIAV